MAQLAQLPTEFGILEIEEKQVVEDFAFAEGLGADQDGGAGRESNFAGLVE
jgi:hypothetical protein